MKTTTLSASIVFLFVCLNNLKAQNLERIDVSSDCQSITACFGVPTTNTTYDFTGMTMDFQFNSISNPNASLSFIQQIPTDPVQGVAFDNGAARGVCSVVTAVYGDCDPIYFNPRMTVRDGGGALVNYEESGIVFPLDGVGFETLRPATVTIGRIGFYPVLSFNSFDGPLATTWEVTGPGGQICDSGSFCGGDVILEYNEITAFDEINYPVAQGLESLLGRDAYFTCTLRDTITSTCIPAPIPTSTEWTLLILGLLLCILAFVAIKNRKSIKVVHS